MHRTSSHPRNNIRGCPSSVCLCVVAGEVRLTTPTTGIAITLVAQALRSGAMIHASSNFSHSVAFQKLDQHKLVTDGIYGCVQSPNVGRESPLTCCSSDGCDTRRILAFSTGALARNSSFRIPSPSSDTSSLCGGSSLFGSEVRSPETVNPLTSTYLHFIQLRNSNLSNSSETTTLHIGRGLAL